MSKKARGWLIDTLAGGLLGGIAAAITAVNIVIYSGIDDGYEASIPEVFRQNTYVGTTVAVLLIGGPLVGVFLARRFRRKRSQAETAG